MTLVNTQTAPTMFSGSILPMTVKFSTPIAMSLLVSYLYVICDTVFIAHIDKSSTALLSGTGLIYPIYTVILTVGKGLIVGVGSLTARGIGARKPEVLSHAADSGLFLSLMISLAVLIAGVLGGDRLAELLAGSKLSAEALDNAKTYFTYLLPGLALMPPLYALYGPLQGEGLMRYMALSAMISCALNIVLDAFLIFGMGMGVKGAAVATSISLAAALIITVSVFFRNKSSVPPSWRIQNVRSACMTEIVRIGFPECVALFTVVLFYLFTNNLISSISEAAMNAWVMVNRIDQLMMIPVFAISGATITMVGQNFGRENYERARDIYRANLTFGVVVVLSLAVFYNLFAGPLYGLLSNSPAVIGNAVLQVRFTSMGYIATLGLATMAAVFQATGKPVPALVLRSLWSIMTIPAVYLAVTVFDFGMVGVFVCMISINYIDLCLALLWTHHHLRGHETA